MHVIHTSLRSFFFVFNYFQHDCSHCLTDPKLDAYNEKTLLPRPVGPTLRSRFCTPTTLTANSRSCDSLHIHFAPTNGRLMLILLHVRIGFLLELGSGVYFWSCAGSPGFLGLVNIKYLFELVGNQRPIFFGDLTVAAEMN